MVEFVLLLPLLLMLVVGMVSAGIGFSHKLAVTHSAREAGRYAATLPVVNFASDPDPMVSWLDVIAARVVDNATGSLGPGAPGFFVCVAYVHKNGTAQVDETRSRLESPEGVVSYPFEPCFMDGQPDDERRVQVRVGRDTEFQAIVFSRTVALRSDAVTKFEATLLP